jgi:hypothetical protein
VPELMCRSTVSVAWDGTLWDCECVGRAVLRRARVRACVRVPRAPAPARA